MKLAGNRVVLGIALLRMVSLAAFAVAIWCLPRLARRSGVDGRRAFWLAALNPLVLAHLVAGVHNDVLMLALLLVGMVAGIRGRLVLAGALIGLAALVKAPALVALPFLLVAAPRRWRAAIELVAGCGGMMLLVTWAMGSWYGWVAAIGGTTRVHNGLSVTTDVGDGLSLLFGHAPIDPVEAVRGVGMLAGAVLVLVLLVRCRHQPVPGIGLALAAVVLLGPVVHPWYLLWAVLPLAASVRRPVLVRPVVAISVLAAFYPEPSGGGPTSDVLVGLLTAAVSGPLLWWWTSRTATATTAPLPARWRPLPDSEPIAS